jgi:NADPH:quinone reductase-like Zn-dependent oxidoreductase
MKAIVYTRYGPPDGIELRDVEKPAPKEGEVLVKIHAASLNAYDWHLLTADIFLVRLNVGLLRPKNTRLGADLAGTIEAVGSQVTQFQPGDEVYGDIAGAGTGSLAEYAAVPARALAKKPAKLSFAEAAAVPMAGITALQGLRDEGQIQAGQKVLIHGASGGVGTFAVQLAKLLGGEVTAVCSTRNVEQAYALGADHVIDYKKEDFTQNGVLYDLILGVNGYRSLAEYRGALAPQGRYIMAGGTPKQIFQAVLMGSWMSRSGQKMGSVSAHANPQDLDTLSEWIEQGKVVPVIDRRYPLSETVEALRYLGDGHARGKVVVSVAAA